jgi:hypothetical protein
MSTEAISYKILFCCYLNFGGNKLVRLPLHHDTQQNNTQHNDTQNNNTQHKDTQHNHIQQYYPQHK